MTKLPFDLHPEGFLDLEPDQYPSYQDARSVIIPFGLEASVSYGKGTSKGPAAILAAGPQVELFDEVLWKEPHHDFQAVVLSARGGERAVRALALGATGVDGQ